MTREDVASICKALSDTNRLKIVKVLTCGEKCACKILSDLQITQPTLSHHMKVLIDSGLVNARKNGKWQYYTINARRFSEYKEYIGTLTCEKTAVCNK